MYSPPPVDTAWLACAPADPTSTAYIVVDRFTASGGTTPIAGPALPTTSNPVAVAASQNGTAPFVFFTRTVPDLGLELFAPTSGATSPAATNLPVFGLFLEATDTMPSNIVGLGITSATQSVTAATINVSTAPLAIMPNYPAAVQGFAIHATNTSTGAGPFFAFNRAQSVELISPSGGASISDPAVTSVDIAATRIGGLQVARGRLAGEVVFEDIDPTTLTSSPASPATINLRTQVRQIAGTMDRGTDSPWWAVSSGGGAAMIVLSAGTNESIALPLDTTVFNSCQGLTISSAPDDTNGVIVAAHCSDGVTSQRVLAWFVRRGSIADAGVDAAVDGDVDAASDVATDEGPDAATAEDASAADVFDAAMDASTGLDVQPPGTGPSFRGGGCSCRVSHAPNARTAGYAVFVAAALLARRVRRRLRSTR